MSDPYRVSAPRPPPEKEKEKTMTKLEELKAKREALREAEEMLEAEQSEIDMAALVSAEEEHGFGSVRAIYFRGYRRGSPTLAIVIAPERGHYREYLKNVRGGKTDTAKGEASERLGESCMVYPPAGSEARRAMLQARPGVYVVAGIEVAKLAEGGIEEEKKG